MSQSISSSPTLLEQFLIDSGVPKFENQDYVDHIATKAEDAKRKGLQKKAFRLWRRVGHHCHAADVAAKLAKEGHWFKKIYWNRKAKKNHRQAMRDCLYDAHYGSYWNSMEILEEVVEDSGTNPKIAIRMCERRGNRDAAIKLAKKYGLTKAVERLSNKEIKFFIKRGHPDLAADIAKKLGWDGKADQLYRIALAKWGNLNTSGDYRKALFIAKRANLPEMVDAYERQLGAGKYSLTNMLHNFREKQQRTY